LPSIVTHGTSGVVFAPADPQSLLFEVRAAWETPRLLEQLAQGARAEFERRYTEATNYETLLRIYTHAVAASQGLAQENSG
jgi:glycosyltransferase involved in cell wall biosynthesis